MNPKIPATAAMLVKNSERYLHEVLTALQDFDEVLLLDNGSTDRTFEIAERFTNVSYYKYDFIGFGPMKNLAARLAQNNWIFSIDSDEVADGELIAAIRKAVAENKEQNIFSLSRLNHYNGRLIKACGWYPDIIPRLYHRRFTRFSDRQVHESLILPPDANVRPLEGRLNERNRNISVALIVTTYNRPDALELVLKSALAQTRLPDEIIVADDGSRQDTAEVVEFIRSYTDIPVKHSWRPDDGFRAAESRNRALAQAKSDYIILIDGDMILDPSFIADHLKLARKGRLIQGSRVILTQSRTQEILDSGELPDLSVFSQGIEKRLSALRCRSLSALIGRQSSRKHKGIKTCNMGFSHSDALAVNGFDNRFVGWGREDSEFVARLFHNGMKRHNLKFAGIAYHLWHHEAERDALPQNDALLKATLSEQKIRCEDGMDEFIK